MTRLEWEALAVSASLWSLRGGDRCYRGLGGRNGGKVGSDITKGSLRSLHGGVTATKAGRHDRVTATGSDVDDRATRTSAMILAEGDEGWFAGCRSCLRRSGGKRGWGWRQAGRAARSHCCGSCSGKTWMGLARC
ncbi:hypothetical protein BHE74_00051412 [Ensete ventricosum]|nr:hypothetical protein BHE74_00051412 [Ensete ventricosum]